MPRLKQRQVPYYRLQRLIRSYGLNGTRLAPALGVSAPTARKKIENPMLLTIEDLDSMNRYLGIPMEELREAIVR